MSAPEPLRLLRLPAGVTPAEEFPDRLGESPEEAQERRQRANEHRRRLWDHRVPSRFASASLEDLTDDQNPGGRVADWWDRGVLTLVLRSERNGVGKSHAAYAIGNHAMAQAEDVWAVCWTMIGLNDAFRPSGDDTAYGVAQTCDLLLVDDVGREKISEWTLERMQGVLDARWSERRRTILTTRLTGEQFVERYGGSISDRVRDDAWVVEVKGESRRAPAPW